MPFVILRTSCFQFMENGKHLTKMTSSQNVKSCGIFFLTAIIYFSALTLHNVFKLTLKDVIWDYYVI